MSGIAAIFNRDGRPAESRMIKAMLDAIHHRGPDREGVWIEGAVALGQRMLHATPEAVAEQQPWSDEGRRYRLVFDGRIDNGVDLQLQLSAAGVETRINTDAELILRSYQCWGEKPQEVTFGGLRGSLPQPEYYAFQIYPQSSITPPRAQRGRRCVALPAQPQPILKSRFHDTSLILSQRRKRFNIVSLKQPESGPFSICPSETQTES